MDDGPGRGWSVGRGPGRSGERRRRRAALGAAASLVGLAVATGLLAAAWAHVQHGGPATHAGLFAPAVVDLQLRGERGVHGFVGGHNLASGDRLAGALVLSSAQPLPPGAFDLDFDVRWEPAGSGGAGEGSSRRGSPPGPGPTAADDPGHGPSRGAASPSLADLLVVTRLAWGRDDLLAAPGRNLTAEIDADPRRGDGDGQLTLREMAWGANDLPPPGPGGTPWEVGFVLRPPAPGAAWSAEGLQVTFVWRLGAVHDADLN